MKRHICAIIRCKTQILYALTKDEDLAGWNECVYPYVKAEEGESTPHAIKRLVDYLFRGNAKIEGRYATYVVKDYEQPIRFSFYLVSTDTLGFVEMPEFQEMKWADASDWRCFDEFMPDVHYECYRFLRYYFTSDRWQETTDWQDKIEK